MIKKVFLVLFVSLLFLTGCSEPINPDLNQEEVGDLQAQITELQDFIKNNPTEEGAPPHLSVIELAQTYEQLGQSGKAIDVYKDYLGGGFRAKAIRNNLGRLYEAQEDYDKAVEQYKLIVDEYFDEQYFYDITWAYIRAKNRQEAEKFFNAWQRAFTKTDVQTQNAIKKLREEEKAR